MIQDVSLLIGIESNSFIDELQFHLSGDAKGGQGEERNNESRSVAKANHKWSDVTSLNPESASVPDK